MATVFWAAVGGLVVVLLVIAALLDHRAKQRRARTATSQQIWDHVREERRDAKIVANTPLLAPKNLSWTSWSKRDHGRR